MINWYKQYPQDDIELVKTYLKDRYQEKRVHPQISIVYDLLHLCRLHCRGCGTNAIMCLDATLKKCGSSLGEIEGVLLKIKEYVDLRGIPVFINFGGGEPFLREDIIDILKLAASIFSEQSVGIDTSGTLDNSCELLNMASDFCAYIGISINGLADYSQWWAGNNNINVYDRQIKLLQNLDLLHNAGLANKVEVTSVATKKNLGELPLLMEILKKAGVKKYSVHRSIPVGRMKEIADIVPSAKDYFELLIQLIKKSRELGLACHLHHSIESIHTTLLLGCDTYKSDRIGNPDISSSIGIEPGGEIVYDPWCTTDYWKALSTGNIIESDLTLYDMIHADNSFFERAKRAINRKTRCDGCQYPCSGGSRIVAAVEHLNRLNYPEAKIDDLIHAMCSKDPGCPLG